MTRIGFVGLGTMGLPMARNLLKAGHAVTGFDLNEAALIAFAAAGGSRAADANAAAQGQDFVITMLPTGRHVREVMLGPRDDLGGNMGGMAAHSDPATVFIDCSTIDVATAREMAEKAGRPVVDAPVSGGQMGAENGTLTFMVGGTQEAFEQAATVLKDMGKAVIRCGDAGAGQIVKACNNMMLAASMIATCEALVMAERLGVSHQAVFDVVGKSTGQCFALTGYAPVPGLVPASPANRDYRPGFTAALMLKDLGLAQEGMRDAGVDSRIGAMAEELYRRFVEQKDGGALDFSGIIRMVRGEG
jgi:3-hydroxyisobutyrate dehydrogenase